MTSIFARTCQQIGFVVLAAVLTVGSALAQTTAAPAHANASLRGTVTDPTGAVVAGAWVTLESAAGQKFYETTSREGRYQFDRLPRGHYRLFVRQPGFMEYSSALDVPGAPAFDVQLRIAISVKVDVRESAGLSPDPHRNLSGLVLTGKDLAAMPDDPRLLLLRILDLAGATGKPDEVAVYVNGFREYKRLPQKSTIELVRINSNLFSPEFSQPGAQRVEIVTKPGSDTVHGDVAVQTRAARLDTRDPITNAKPDTRYYNYRGYVQGPLVKDHIGYLVSGGYWKQDDNAFLHATVLTPQGVSQPLSGRISTPTDVKSSSGELDLKFGSDLINLSFARNSESNRNLGLQSGFDLPEHGYNRSATDDVGRMWWTTVANSMVNDLRVEVTRTSSATTPLAFTPAVLVLDSFNAGGNQEAGTNRWTFGVQSSETLTIQRARHTVKTGVQLEMLRWHVFDEAGFNGMFTFGADVERNGAGLPIVGASGATIPISPLERYRRTALGVPGYLPSQFLIEWGNPDARIQQRNVGWFALDDWAVSPRLTFSYGVRQELQNDVTFRMNLAPRAGLSWLADEAGRNAIKVGGGVFYRRVDPQIQYDVTRLDGVNRSQITIEQPAFFSTERAPLAGAATQSAVYVKAEDLRNPMALVSTASYERQLPAHVFAVVQYQLNKGIDQLRLRNLTAPAPGSAGPPPDPVLQFESSGRSMQQQVMFGVRQSIEGFSLHANYTYGEKRTDTDGPYTLPADSHDLVSEYGWATDDQRHVLVAGASIEVSEDLIISPSITVASGRPFNITTGLDNNNDTRFTDRPAFAAANDPAAIETAFGRFDPNPRPDGTIIPRNFGREPRQMTFDVSATKGLSKRMMLTVDVLNVFNNARLYGSTSVLASELFGIPNLALNGRRVWATVRYGF